MKDTYLYVLLLPHMDKEYNLDYIVKFGFTEDFNRRLKVGYEAYYDSISVLHVYKGKFTKEDEFTIIQYLKEYCINGKEWFKCCQEVLGFFNTYNTSDKLKEKINEIPVSKKSEITIKHYKVDYFLLDYLIQTYYEENKKDILEVDKKQKELKQSLWIYSEENQFRYLKEKYKFDKLDFEKYKKLRLSNSSDSVKNTVEKFSNLKRVNDRIKFMMDYSEVAKKEDFENFLELIPGKYKDYYTIVGPDIIKAFGCEESKIKKAWMEKIANEEIYDDVMTEIYGTFFVGKRYTKKLIKELLGDIYQRLGYKKKAKATDLEVYFYLKPILTPQKEHGFELIGRR